MTIWILTLLILLWEVDVTSGKCSCIPANMTFQLNASNGCTLKVQDPLGISDSFCTIRESKYQKNLIPVNFDLIKIFKLNENLYTTGTPIVVKGATYGDNITLTFDVSGSDATASLIGGIQFMLQGSNSDGNGVTQDQIISFANDCRSFVFYEGDQIGWLRVVSFDTYLALIVLVLYYHLTQMISSFALQNSVIQPSQETCPVAATQQSSEASNLTYTMTDDSVGSTTVQLSDAWVENQPASKSYSYSYRYRHSNAWYSTLVNSFSSMSYSYSYSTSYSYTYNRRSHSKKSESDLVIKVKQQKQSEKSKRSKSKSKGKVSKSKSYMAKEAPSNMSYHLKEKTQSKGDSPKMKGSPEKTSQKVSSKKSSQ